MGRNDWTIENIINDIVIVLHSEMSQQGKKVLIDKAIWAWTEIGDTKHEGNLIWSINAIKKYNAQVQDLNLKNKHEGLIHEHVVPRIIIVNHFLSLNVNIVNKLLVLEILKKLAISAVITKDEDCLLPVTGLKLKSDIFAMTQEEIWARYKGTKIVICDVEWEKNKMIKNDVKFDFH